MTAPRQPIVEAPGVDPVYGGDGSVAPLDWATVTGWIEAARTFWLATVRPGRPPHVAPVWMAWLEDSLLFCAQPGSAKGRALAAAGEATVHLDGNEQVCILECRVTREDPARWRDTLPPAFQDRYGMDVPLDAPDYGVYRLVPVRALAWHEADFPVSMTRFRFPLDPAPVS